ncbi:MAG: hypothetical protein FJ271_32170 [Planctomycetes bacterium]|nr:hypothetical protein [Planctomycetota bacterium]
MSNVTRRPRLLSFVVRRIDKRSAALMGMRASLTLISPKAYSAMVKYPQNADVSLEGRRYDIDKAFSEFHEVFILWEA